MKFPVTVRFRKAEVKIYGKSAAYSFYRLSYYAAGKRHTQSFSSFKEAHTTAKAKARELAKGNQSLALTPKEATAALSIRDGLEAHRIETGQSFTALEAVTGFLNAMKHLPIGCGLTESLKTFSSTLATIKPKLISSIRRAYHDLAPKICRVLPRSPSPRPKPGFPQQIHGQFCKNIAQITQ